MAEGRLKVTEGYSDFLFFFALIDDGDPNFPIVTPKIPALPPVNESPVPVTAEAVNAVKKRRIGLAPPVLKGC